MSSDRRVSVITGGARGMGRAVAEQFCRDGDLVVIVDRDSAAGEATAAELAAAGGTVRFEHLDVSDEDAVAALAERLAADPGRVDVLINNAGIAPREGSVVALPRKKWDLAIAVNLTSVYLMCHYLVPLMPPGSSVVNVATAAVQRAVPGTDAYLAAKGGVVTLTKAMAVSLGETGVRFNVVSPHVILTDEVASRISDPRVQAMSGRMGEPLGRGHGQPHEFADLVRYLCSPQASFVNGLNIQLDGGASA